ncbi:MAG: HAMP domain-containing histidine kinase [Armatimonadetes bacterium]|nr:HAMP domain-containing histidine kinase [Armatimonadota bacterium]
MDLVYDFRRETDSPPGAAAEQAERLLACFQAGLGHELPNRLVALQGTARMLEALAGDRLDGETRQLLGNLASLARRTDELARALAAVGRLRRELKAGGTAVPDEVVAEAAAETNLLSPGRPVEYHLGGALPVLPVPRGVLHQVLLQLLRNAVQAAVAGRPPRVRLSAERVAGGVEFRVADNGRGLDDSQAERLGEPFRSAGPDRQGLGLFLVRQLVAEWGGVLRLHSEPGRGTTVSVLVPVRPGG